MRGREWKQQLYGAIVWRQGWGHEKVSLWMHKIAAARLSCKGALISEVVVAVSVGSGCWQVLDGPFFWAGDFSWNQPWELGLQSALMWRLHDQRTWPCGMLEYHAIGMLVASTTAPPFPPCCCQQLLPQYFRVVLLGPGEVSFPASQIEWPKMPACQLWLQFSSMFLFAGSPTVDDLDTKVTYTSGICQTLRGNACSRHNLTNFLTFLWPHLNPV